MEKLNINNIISEELKTVLEAREKYGEFYSLASNLCSFLFEFINSVTKEGMLFHAFYTSSSKSLCLAFLSILRKHNYQSHLMIRNALEYIALACYALYRSNISEFGNFINESEFESNEKVKNKAFKWLKKEYPKETLELKSLSNNINCFFAHANLNNTKFNLEYHQGRIDTHFTDIIDDSSVRNQIGGFCKLVLMLLRLIVKVVSDYPIISFSDSFDSSISNFMVKYNNIASSKDLPK